MSALDVSIQSQILNLLLDLREEFDLTYLFIAHNLSVVQYVSDRVGVMYLGGIVELADSETLYATPPSLHGGPAHSGAGAGPHAPPPAHHPQGRRPSPAATIEGCRFKGRCWLREQLDDPEECDTQRPELREILPGQRWPAISASRSSPSGSSGCQGYRAAGLSAEASGPASDG